MLNGQSLLISWNLETLLYNLHIGYPHHTPSIPLVLNSLRLFPTPIANCLLPFHPLIIRSFYSSSQFQFFFSDERITDSLIYTSSVHPSLVFGTNYGRIFVTALFQEADEKVFPVVLIDSHHQSPIT